MLERRDSPMRYDMLDFVWTRGQLWCSECSDKRSSGVRVDEEREIGSQEA